MRMFPTSVFALLALFVVSPLQAQDDAAPPSLFVTGWTCNQGALDSLMTLAGEQGMPIAQALVDEGKLRNYLVMRHAWGDEANYVTIMIADDVASGIAASDELFQRVQEKYGSAGDYLIQNCPTHEDAIYRASFVTDESNVSIETPYAMLMSYYACPLTRLGDVAQMGRERLLPAAQASVEAGKGYFVGAMVHDWGGKWTYVLAWGARDVSSLFEFLDDTGNRDGGERPVVLDACGLHKDNIYRVMHATRSPAQEE